MNIATSFRPHQRLIMHKRPLDKRLIRHKRLVIHTLLKNSRSEAEVVDEKLPLLSTTFLPNLAERKVRKFLFLE